MRRQWLVSLTVVVAVMICSAPASADKPFDESSIVGTFAFTTIQVRNGEGEEPPVVFCSGYGTITFDGSEEADIQGAERCSGEVDATPYSHAYRYFVEDEPFFSIEEPDGFLTHCQVLDRGDVIMCDGTSREDAMLAFHAVGFRQ